MPWQRLVHSRVETLRVAEAVAGGVNNGFRDIVINELSIPGEFNVKMRVLVAEINRSELRNAGFDWKVLFGDGRHAVGSNDGRQHRHHV